jgi:hypothetical protein
MWEKELSLGKAGKDFWGKTASWTTERASMHYVLQGLRVLTRRGRLQRLFVIVAMVCF